jgi:hypothetical protein
LSDGGDSTLRRLRQPLRRSRQYEDEKPGSEPHP